MDFPRTPRRIDTSRESNYAETPRRLNSSFQPDFPRTPLRRTSTPESDFPRTPLRRTSALESHFPGTPRSDFPRTPRRRSAAGEVDFPQTPRRRRNPPPQQPQPKSISSALPHRLVVLLNDHFKTRDDSSRAASLQSQINGECIALEKTVSELKDKVSLACSQWISRSEEFGRIVDGFGSMLPESQGGDMERMVRVELPNLAKEVCRIQTIQLYAEKALKLEALVGNLEDSAFTIVRQTSTNKSFLGLQHVPNFNNMQWKQEKLLNAISVMKEIEQELIEICTTRPKWCNLVKAVDSRVEKTLSILRPQALTDYRALLASLGWPPPLVTSQTDNQPQLVPNPLLLIDSTKREIYSQSFLALCALQHVQYQRDARQSMKDEKLQKGPSFENGLWAIDELVQPIASRMEHHFAKWSDQPEFIFALVFKITKEFMDGVDDVLQPLIDKARLSGLSAKEAWVSSMIKVLLGYLEKEIFPPLVTNFCENKDECIEVSSSWLNLMDLMISFDKRMRVLSSSGIQKIEPLLDLNETISKSVSILSIFDEHLDWLKIWAKIEVSVAQEKSKPELENEKSWYYETKDQAQVEGEEHDNKFLLSTREEYKAPPIVDSIVKNASLMIERGRALPTKSTKIEFIRKSGVLFLNHFFVLLLQKCRDLELITSAIDEDAMVTIACSINAARYFESVICEWDEDISFLDLDVGDKNSSRSFFADEISFLVKLETDCLEEIMSGILLEFEALSYDYIQNIDQWEDEGLEQKIDILEDELENGAITLGFIEALEILRDRTLKLKNLLNSKDFFDLWRSVAEGLDYYIFSSIPWSDVRFSNSGVYQFRVDMRALFLVFRPLCARPEAFFPFVSDCLKLLSINRKDVEWFLRELMKNESRLKEWLHQKSLYHVSGSQAKMILVDRNFGV